MNLPRLKLPPGLHPFSRLAQVGRRFCGTASAAQVWFVTVRDIVGPRVPSPLRLIVTTLAVVVCSWPPAALVHQLAVIASARILRWVLSLPMVRDAVLNGPGDAVYTRLVLGMLDGVRPLGLALRLPLDGTLSAVAPGLFAPGSNLPEGHWMGVIFAAGSSAVGVQVIQVLVNVTMIALGAVLLTAGYGRSAQSRLGRAFVARPVRIVGLASVAYGSAAQMRLPWSGDTGGEMALTMIATKILRMDSQRYDAALGYGLVLSTAINFLIIGITVTCGLAVVFLSLRLSRWHSALPKIKPNKLLPRVRAGLLATGVSAILFSSPIGPGFGFETIRASASSPELSQAKPAEIPDERGYRCQERHPRSDGGGARKALDRAQRCRAHVDQRWAKLAILGQRPPPGHSGNWL